MLLSPLSWSMITLTLLVVAMPSAFAAPMAKRGKKAVTKRVKPEVYPAMEDGEVEIPSEETRVVEIRQSTRISQSNAIPRAALPKRAIPAKPQTEKLAQSQGTPRRAPRKTQIPASRSRVSADPADTSVQPARKVVASTQFEVVPSDKRDQVLKRIALCEELLKTSGRAYDYRTMTTSDLEKELAAVRLGSTYSSIAVEPASANETVEVPVLDPIFDPNLGE